MRAVDFGRYFSPKITLRLILESTNRQVYMVVIVISYSYTHS